MTKNERIAVGVGLIALGIWIWRRNRPTVTLGKPTVKGSNPNVSLPDDPCARSDDLVWDEDLQRCVEIDEDYIDPEDLAIIDANEQAYLAANLD